MKEKRLRGARGVPTRINLSPVTTLELKLGKAIFGKSFQVKPTRNALIQRAVNFYTAHLERMDSQELEAEKNIMVNLEKEQVVR